MTKITPANPDCYANPEWRVRRSLRLVGRFDPWPLILTADLADTEPRRPGVSSWALYFASDPHLSPLQFVLALRAALRICNVPHSVDFGASLRAAMDTHARYVIREFEAAEAVELNRGETLREAKLLR